ncbi:hypothetical protein [Endozoicomonas sp. ONNA2]|uniref:hypothetical protein n=1 Tax=Endozoicomonas sp. ONNA2 TaxID=2828741 RepID=UPI002147831F|nr:hypothetical protein [Endozoicomonas sp. ONNA2]
MLLSKHHDSHVRYWLLAAMTGVWLSCLAVHGNAAGRQVDQEFGKIEVEFRNESSGLIWAYPCETCLPKRLVFDQRLQVGRLGAGSQEATLQDLRDLEDSPEQPALVIWIENTAQALQVMLITPPQSSAPE